MYPYVYTTLPGGRFHQSEKWLEFKKDFELLSDMPHLDSFILPISSSLENTAMEHYYYEEVDKQSFDDFNLMYVAMTRAKDVLYLYTHNKVSKEKGNIFIDYFNNTNGCQSIEHDDLLKVRFDKIKEFENSDECSDGIYEEYQFGEVKYVPSEEKVDANEIKLSQDNPVPDLIDWSEYMVFKEDDNDEDSESTERGKVVHEICSKIITMKDAEKVLRFYVNNGSIDEDESERLLKKFEKISSDERVGLAYSDNAIVRNEMDILTEDGVKKRPDRYAELDDKVILIDYKTGKKNEKYELQLKEYASILQQMGVSKNIELYLVYLDEENEVEPVFLDRLFY
jgi:ATP-dependent exoDNAse (exonuclease V) beta subunit